MGEPLVGLRGSVGDAQGFGWVRVQEREHSGGRSTPRQREMVTVQGMVSKGVPTRDEHYIPK